MKTPIKSVAAMRSVSKVVHGIPTTDGAGVRLTRIIGSPDLNHLDPFLLLDVFESMNPDDYAAGFPPHPHRGFQTITYMLSGALRHRDNAGHAGQVGPGGVQWMSAGRGVLHEEMPQQQNGLFRGLQLWLNLPARAKFSAPDYRDISAAEIPVVTTPAPVVLTQNTATVRVLAGVYNGQSGPLQDTATALQLLDVLLTAGSRWQHEIPLTHNALLLVLDGDLQIHDAATATTVPRHALAVLDDGAAVDLHAGPAGARAILLCARPLHEPIARGGPFVMNTAEEIQQAFSDYRAGRFGGWPGAATDASGVTG